MSAETRRQRYLIMKGVSATILFCAIIWMTIFIRQTILKRQFRLLINQNRLVESIEVAGKLAWYHPSDINLALIRADLCIQLKENRRAAEILNQLSADATDSILDNFKIGVRMHKLYMYDSALKRLQFVVERDPQHLEAHRLITGIFGIQRRANDQQIALWKWQSSGIGSIEPLRLLAQSDVIIPPGTIPKTLDEGFVLEEILKVEPNSTPSISALAYFYRNRGDLARVSRLLDEALKSQPDASALLTEKLATLIDSGDLDATEQLLQRLKASIPSSPRLLELRADHYRNKGDYRTAKENYEDAIKLNENSPIICFRLAECYRLTGHDSEREIYQEKCRLLKTLAELAAAVDFKSPDPMIMLDIAKVCMKLDRTRESKAWAREVIRISPQNQEAKAIFSGESRN